MLKLDLGSGRQAMEVKDYLHLDKWAGDHIEYVWDLELGLPKNNAGFPVFENSLDEIRMHHVAEHVRNLIQLFDDCWVALKPSGLLHIWVPNAHHVKAAWSDPTHQRAFTCETFDYFTPETLAAFPYTEKAWRIDPGYPVVNGVAPDDLWEVECVLRPIKE